MMKPNDYILMLGMDVILKKCNYSLRSVKTHILRECQLPQKYDMRATMKKFKKYLNERFNQKESPLKTELINKLKEEFYE